MRELIQTALLERGFVSRGRLISLGLTDNDIRVAIRVGELTRLRHGTYAGGPDVRAMSPEERHRLLARSVIGRLGNGFVISHQSAAIMHTGVSFDVDLDTVHVTRLDRRHGRAESGIDFHVNDLPEEDIIELHGVPVVAPGRANFESAVATGTESALVAVNAGLNQRLVSREELDSLAERHVRWPGGRTARLAIGLSDAGCETVGESRSLFLFFENGVPRPETQVVIVDDSGTQVARTDFGWWLFRHVGEFDGSFKYGRLNNFVDPGQVLVYEKRREDAIRAQSIGVSRWGHDALARDVRMETAERIKAAMNQSRRLYTRNATIIPL